MSDGDGVPYVLVAGEQIVFGLKAKPGDAELLLVKTATYVTVGLYEFTLCPEDTEALAPGRYSYDVALQSGTDFYNIIEPSPFVIEPNVTCRGCAN